MIQESIYNYIYLKTMKNTYVREWGYNKKNKKAYIIT